jgi:predicted AAA+ superfamily ATPase
MHSAWSKDKPIKLSSFRTRSGIEVDFVLEKDQNLYGIEVKTSEHVTGDDLIGLQFFDKAVKTKKKLYVFHLGKVERKQNSIWILPWQKGLKEIGL